jgi:alkylation response protein AidB-like acyl-CoA dehydrogenase
MPFEPPLPHQVDMESVRANVRAIAADFATQRHERQQRRTLDAADFQRLAAAGFLLTGVPAEMGGLWQGLPRTARLVCDLLRTLAHGDPSVALVCAMHPTVLAIWLATPEAPEPVRAAWTDQRHRVVSTALEGAWWGTINSEPGSGGDIARTRAVARRDPATQDGSPTYRLSGHKQFGSGSGITAHMMTLAVPDGEEQPDLFFLDTRGLAWDGSTGMHLVAPWDGHGMTATQSHAFRFEDFPATRAAWPRNLSGLAGVAMPFVRTCFTAVCVGIVEVAIATARERLAAQQLAPRAYEQVEWARAELEAWLIEQAYEGMLRSLETPGAEAALATLRGKVAIAELAEAVLTRICRVMGGGTYSRSSPFGCWAHDVQALGFLRPPWGLAFDTLLEATWPKRD